MRRNNPVLLAECCEGDMT